jgi:hypothetical protein
MLNETRRGWSGENVTVSSAGYPPQDFLTTIMKIWPSADIVDQRISVFSEGPFAQGFLATRIAAHISDRASPHSTLNQDQPVVMLFSWTEPDLSELVSTTKILAFFINILEKRKLLGPIVKDIQFYYNQENEFTGYLIFANAESYLTYRQNITSFSINVDESVLALNPTAKVRLVTAFKHELGFDEIAMFGENRAEVIYGSP